MTGVSETAAARRPLSFNPESLRRGFLSALMALVVIVTIWVAVYGFDYYQLEPAQRAFHPKHADLRPSGRIGVRLGILGLLCFFGIYLYAIRKRSARLGKIGKSKNWLDVHVVLGVAAPVLITFHSSFKMQGLAGIAYWIMMAVVASGVIGRYIYAQIPRSMNAAELSLGEIRSMTEEITARLHEQKVITEEQLAPVLAGPNQEEVARMPVFSALWLMFCYDSVRPWRIAAIRRRLMSTPRKILSLGGLLSSHQEELERVLEMARRRSWLTTKLSFLGKTHEVFHLWHVVHRPFSYSFAILTVVHIMVVALMGYF